MDRLFIVVVVIVAAPVSAFERTVHDEITKSLNFLDDCALQAISTANQDRDDLLYFMTRKQDDWHFNDCDFSGSARNIRETYETVLDHLDPRHPAGTRAAREHYGHLLHIVQDFYSHSNWAELLYQPNVGRCAANVDHQPEIVDSTFGNWRWMDPWSTRDDVVFVEGEAPRGFAVSWCSDSKKAVATVPGGAKLKAVVTGKVYYAYYANWLELCNHCPKDMGALHWDRVHPFAPSDDGPNRLHKDVCTSGMHREAKQLAMKQTRHEWCRLVALVHDRYSKAGVQALFSAWVAYPTAARDICIAEPGFPLEASDFP